MKKAIVLLMAMLAITGFSQTTETQISKYSVSTGLVLGAIDGLGPGPMLSAAVNYKVNKYLSLSPKLMVGYSGQQLEWVSYATTDPVTGEVVYSSLMSSHVNSYYDVGVNFAITPLPNLQNRARISIDLGYFRSLEVFMAEQNEYSSMQAWQYLNHGFNYSGGLEVGVLQRDFINVNATAMANVPLFSYHEGSQNPLLGYFGLTTQIKIPFKSASVAAETPNIEKYKAEYIPFISSGFISHNRGNGINTEFGTAILFKKYEVETALRHMNVRSQYGEVTLSAITTNLNVRIVNRLKHGFNLGAGVQFINFGDWYSATDPIINMLGFTFARLKYEYKLNNYRLGLVCSLSGDNDGSAYGGLMLGYKL